MPQAVFWLVRWQSTEHVQNPDGHPAVVRMSMEKHTTPKEAATALYGMWSPEMRAKPLTHLVSQLRRAKWLREQQTSNAGYVDMNGRPATDVPVITDKNTRWS